MGKRKETQDSGRKRCPGFGELLLTKDTPEWLAPPLQSQISKSKPLQASLAFKGDHSRSGLKDSVPEKGCVSHDGT